MFIVQKIACMSTASRSSSPVRKSIAELFARRSTFGLLPDSIVKLRAL